MYDIRYLGQNLDLYVYGTDLVFKTIQFTYLAAIALGIVVFADPNYISGDPSGGASGSIVGSPGGGSRGITTGNSGGKSVNDVYRDHWAFGGWNSSVNGRRGINLNPSGNDSLEEPVGQHGDKVNVIVFDTFDHDLGSINLPIPNNLGVTLNENVTVPALLNIDSGFGLTVAEPIPEVLFDAGISLDDMDDHGGYVASLIKRVAPNARIFLLNCLNSQTLGELFLLETQLANIPQAFQPINSDEECRLRNLVINLSLEAKVPNHILLGQMLIPMLDAANSNGYGNGSMLRFLIEMIDHDYFIASLRLPIIFLYSLGAVLVAASGNDGGKTQSTPPSDIPGRYPEVISVMASNSLGVKSNFSNFGDVMAPGGGLIGESMHIFQNTPLDELCGLLLDVTPHAMIGRVAINSNNPEGLAVWWGTSFATPLVSGLAALLLEKNNGNITPQKVKEIITKRQNTNDGVIDVRKVLAASP